MTEVIKIENLNKYFGKLHVLKDINLSINKGEVLSIIGPSGSGKSTLLRCLNHLETAQSGNIMILGKEIAKAENGKTVYKSSKEILKTSSKLGMVFQNFNLFPHMSVLENITLAPITVQNLSKEKAYKKAKNILEKVGLSEKENEYPSKLSGGQKQRVAIARALAMEPEVMLFDEPTSALDPELIGEVLKTIKDLARENMTMLIVTHEMTFAREVSTRSIFMDDGEIILEGTPKEVFEIKDHPRVKSFLKKLEG